MQRNPDTIRMIIQISIALFLLGALFFIMTIPVAPTHTSLNDYDLHYNQFSGIDPPGSRFREHCQAANFECFSNFAPLTIYNQYDDDNDDFDDDTSSSSTCNFYCLSLSLMAGVVGLIIIIVILTNQKQKKWWNSLPQEYQDYYTSLGYQRKSLYKMHLAGQLPAMPFVSPTPMARPSFTPTPAARPSFTSSTGIPQKKACLSCGQMVDIRYSICPFCQSPTAPKRRSPESRSAAPTSRPRPPIFNDSPPVIIQNIGEYIAGSKTKISDSVIQRSEIGTSRTPGVSELANANKDAVLNEYKIILTHVWSDGKISEGEKAILDHIRWRDEINEEDHRKVENEILREMAKRYSK